ncbi:hypothetical protein LEMLEM_LOCUS6672 [Lemmus lemmus]
MRGGGETNWRPSVESEQPALQGRPEIQPGALLGHQLAHSSYKLLELSKMMVASL